ncbi:MAG: TetR/AcrR family transcriptional regulator [Alphaproteobacteria bacterium]|nr:TetR/AcrR family transcriptional regulator [Alphaproteobacteria bacterium]MDE1985261.1 TetR/AcrR family transcriptional regulator [Alphaproteobacteria bacterium]MDE2162600.1 TetR/AcrR family transcriptional regulator [Alphaproteobacteria bacterium]MDE2266885.1 TetR/AcrR family transcriptional regulator [Alphaproteobacteria bacterium]MDE2500216.1 TetR/AcrR family transcriptional regulator [Alphaproteobacteria bacterium]
MGPPTLAKPPVASRPARRKPESLAKIKRAARKLFVERGYHATRPQDIAREAGLGHGTFYLYYEDKRACFMAFVEDARAELHSHIRHRMASNRSLEDTISATLNAIYEYSDTHPGVLEAAMTDEAVIDAEGAQAVPLLLRWGRDWAQNVQDAMRNGAAVKGYDADIVGQAIVGAIHQCRSEGDRVGRRRQEVVDNLTRFLVRALKP